MNVISNIKIGFVVGALLIATGVQAKKSTTNREVQFTNKQVNVWQTTIYPSSHQVLVMHRHESNRIVVALTGGLLRITNDKGKVHYLHLKKDKAYFLLKDIPNELHMDENMSNHPIKVMVIELVSN